MRRVAFDIMVALVAVACLAGCTKELGDEVAHKVIADDECVLMLNMGVSGLDMSVDTKAAAGNWIQAQIGMTNVAIALFDHDSGEKVYSGAQYPFKLISTSAPYQLAWALGNFSPVAGKTYDLAFASNFCYLAELNAFLNVASWSDLTNPAPNSRTFQFTRYNMSNPTQVVSSTGVAENGPIVDGYGGTMYVNQWRSPELTGVIRGLRLVAGGVNVVGFKREGDNYLPSVSLDVINHDIGTNFDTLPTLHDASDGEDDNSKRVMTIAPCYALVVVDGITNRTEGKLEITDIFMMNVPIFHHIFHDGTYHFGSSGNNFQNAIGSATYSTGKDLVSGFDPTWIDADFRARSVEDDFARILHYPVTSKVSQADFLRVYATGDLNNSAYFFNLKATNQLLDRLCVTKGSGKIDDFSGRMSGNWDWLCSNFDLKYVTATVRKAPFFLISQNDADYPFDTTLDEDGRRQYLYATRLVIRGKWKDTPESTPEVVYYPIIVNGPNQGYNAEYTDDSAEKQNNFVKAGRRYIYNISIESKGVHNPWTPSRVEVKLGSVELKIDLWSYVNVEMPKYIY